MIPISSRARYGLRALIVLARTDGRQPLSLNQIAAEENLSIKYLENIFSLLKRHRIVSSLRGSEGGYKLAKKPESIRLWDIMNALEGPMDSVDCKSNVCENHDACLSRRFWTEFEDHIRQFLDTKTLNDIVSTKKGDI
jgi:Rrf2 family cysteine metabolism transcriptional repressor